MQVSEVFTGGFPTDRDDWRHDRDRDRGRRGHWENDRDRWGHWHRRWAW